MSTTTTTTAPSSRDGGLLWENPPARAQQPRRFAQTAPLLLARPGEWAVVASFPRSRQRRAWGLASAINGGKYPELREGFEACARTSGDEARVYLRAVKGATR